MSERRPFNEMCAKAQGFVDWYRAKCQQGSLPLDDRTLFEEAWDHYAGKLQDWDSVSASALYMFAAAALGFRRDHRPRIVVWRDAGGRPRHHPPPWPETPESMPSLERMITTCTASEWRRYTAA